MLKKIYILFSKSPIGKKAKGFITNPRELLYSSLLLVTTVIIIFLLSTSNTIPHQHDIENINTTWTCSMHPQISLPKPGKCPICFMDLIPIKTEGEALSDTEIKLSETAKRLAKIKSIKVKKDFVNKNISLSGMVMADESKEGKVTSRFQGRIEKMYISFSGVRVKKGEHLYKIYSPEIFQIQQSLIESLKNFNNIKGNGNQTLIKSSQTALFASREKLRLYGLSPGQIKRLEQNKKPRETIDIFSPVSGIVLLKNKKEGDYVNVGTVVYHIADLSSIWVVFDVYEKDIQWVKYGQPISVTFESYPGKVYDSRVSYIDSIVDMKSRTVKLRITLPNKNYILKPGMFASGDIMSTLTPEGMFVNKDLHDKYICPMHPEIVKSTKSTCPICKMNLVTTRSLGYTSEAKAITKKILIPVTAPLITGKRAIVYVEREHNGEYIYEGREVTLGPRAGDFYTVEKGLNEGEVVAIEGVFQIDSAMQILSKNSMMNPKSDSKNTSDTHSTTPKKNLHITGIENIFAFYTDTVKHLAADNHPSALISLQKYLTALKSISSKSATVYVESISVAAKSALNSKDLESFRLSFKGISTKTIEFSKNIHNFPVEINLFYCPMYEKGSYWLNIGNEVINPYYGKKMLKCGEKIGSPLKM